MAVDTEEIVQASLTTTPQTLEALIEETGLTEPQVLSALMILEIKRIAKQYTQHRFSLYPSK